VIYLKIGKECFELNEEQLKEAIRQGLVEGHDIVKSDEHTDGAWLVIGKVEPFRTWLLELAPKEIDVLEVPPAKRALIERQKEIMEELKREGVELECPVCGRNGMPVPSAVYPGKFYCRRCEEYYNIPVGKKIKKDDLN